MMRDRFTFAALWCACMIAAAGLLLLAPACSSGSKAKPQDCSTAYGCGFPGPIPSGDEIYAAQRRAADKLKAEIAAGRLFIRKPVNLDEFPKVEFVPAPFWVANPDSNPNGTGGPPQCAKAKTTDKGKRIVVSTCIESETLSLVEWETRNSFLWRGGRKDLAH